MCVALKVLVCVFFSFLKIIISLIFHSVCEMLYNS